MKPCAFFFFAGAFFFFCVAWNLAWFARFVSSSLTRLVQPPPPPPPKAKLLKGFVAAACVGRGTLFATALFFVAPVFWGMSE